MYVHIAVLLAFVGPRPPGLEARHRDGDDANNKLSNLEWATKSRNTQDRKWHKGSIGYKLKPREVLIIRELLTDGHSHSAIAARFNVSKGTIGFIKRGQTHKDVV
jgi:DNA-binding NarL/FixJ family response regulator